MFKPNFENIQQVLNNKRPQRLPIYEHIISHNIMEKILNKSFAVLSTGDDADLSEYFKHYNNFFRDMTYDTVSFEKCITEILPDSGAIMGGRPGPIQTRDDFEKYPWDELPVRFWNNAERHFETLIKNMPAGMKAIGGIGNGVFEISEDLVGFEYLCYKQAEDPELFADIFAKIGDLMVTIWEKFMLDYSEHFVGCRFGDDLGFKTSVLLAPVTIRQHIFPQYKRIIDIIHRHNKPFLWHSCGCIFDVMEDAVALGINAKHSNEDIIAPFDKWIELYGDRIGLLGGIDLDVLCRNNPQKITELVVEAGTRFRNKAAGFALGSGNSIPDYVPVEGFLAMIEGAKRIRDAE